LSGFNHSNHFETPILGQAPRSQRETTSRAVNCLNTTPGTGRTSRVSTCTKSPGLQTVIQAHGRATAQSAAEFLETLLHRMPFPIRARQVDGGSEFSAQFEQSCQQRGLRLFVLPPRSPKLNGTVERANRTHTEEFYQVTACSLEMKKLNRELRQWEHIYNTVRPHQSLGYLTPHQFSVPVLISTKGMKVSPIYWTSTGS